MLKISELHLVPATRKYKIPEAEVTKPRDQDYQTCPRKKVIWDDERRRAHSEALRAGKRWKKI